MVEALANKKEYQVFYKFSDVIETIEASSKGEAEEIADKRIKSGRINIKGDTYCYEIEVEEEE